MASRDEDFAELGSFTNDSAMMIAYERGLESSRPDAFFQDPFAKTLAGKKGETLSEQFGSYCAMFGFAEWPEFHKTWTAVRTKFIDDRVAEFAAAGTLRQLVNLGAGCDTRAYRLECYKAFTSGSFEVDMETVNEGKSKIFSELLNTPKPHCGDVYSISLDFLDKEKALSSELASQASFDGAKPSLFISEGLIMYLGAEGKLKFIRDVSAVAAPGSVFILQFFAPSDSEFSKSNPVALANALSVDEARSELTSNGWSQLEFSHFGDEKLNFGRFPSDRFRPSVSFSFVVCVKS
mmetsp:Transcript_34371/g.94683  ORF Transcript_34371/g.94683 Transcript_34371/m.94683 type:complete len:293 (-) Transcript_34371:71-949(-)